jgi:formimidoylglutamate deiminase
LSNQPKNKIIKVERIFLDGKWQSDICVMLNEKGLIEKSDKTEAAKFLPGTYLPSLINYHSHCFQYAMVGLGEYFKKGGGEDFWSWRKAMYELASKVSPDHLYRIAKMLYSQMKANGYDSVVEFHYLHHDKNGERFSNKIEMSLALIRAAEEVGLDLMLCPVFYKTSDFGKEASTGQSRFIFRDSDEYLSLIDSLKKEEKRQTNLTILAGAHSLRACPADDLKEIYSETTNDFHIHISEQLKEIESCVAFYGKRPVEWLLDNTSDHSRLQLVHATHLNDTEVMNAANSGANIILCPTTEANLGDGIFRLNEYTARGGLYSIGSDSHVSISPFDELKTLDFSQRLSSRSRSHSLGGLEGEIGNHLYVNATKHRANNNYEAKQNLIQLNTNHPLLTFCNQDKILSTLTSCFSETMISDIYEFKSSSLLSENSSHSPREDFIEICKEFRS